MSRWLSIFALALGTTTHAVARQAPAEKPVAPARTEVLVVGVYHMANPGRDIFNVQVDDVLAPKRQAEMAQLLEVLKRFRPTKIALEAEVSSQRIQNDYADYVAGTRELTRNEKEQIGFRLAKELGHKTVYPVDVDGEFPFQRVVNYAKANNRSPELEAMMGEVGGRVKALDAYLASHSVLETLLYMNADDHVAWDVGFYYRAVRFSEPNEWAGADLVADWFPTQHPHLCQYPPPRRLARRSGAGPLRLRTPRLAATELRQQSRDPLAQARRICQVTAAGTSFGSPGI